MITRSHFLAYRPADGCAPPPLHVESAAPEGNWIPAPRPIAAAVGDPGPSLIDQAGGPCLGIDPTDESTWAGRGYAPSTGMIGWLHDGSRT